MSITIYSLPNCQGCLATKRKADALGLEYREIDLSTAPGEAERLSGYGYTSAPIVEAPVGIMWSGYRPDKLSSLVETL